jgi:hypothetical protein
MGEEADALPLRSAPAVAPARVRVPESAHPHVCTAKPSRDKGMNNIRLKATIRLNGNHALNQQQLKALQPLLERGLAAALPDSIAVDTIRVTKIAELKERPE